jgi:nucleotidyltransferase/DNA polymerase involved in DNA repair
MQGASSFRRASGEFFDVLRRLVEQDRLRNAPEDQLPVDLTEGLAREGSAEVKVWQGLRRP